jgi:CelD/BcsL family acetyltransferase involved in cellulose biosynthesis
MVQASRPDTQIQDFLAQQASEHFYFSPAWLDLITSLYRYTPVELTTTNEQGKLSGFLPLCYMHSPLTGRRLVSLPFSDYCPLLAEDEASANRLVDLAIAEARRRRVRYLELRTGPNEVLASRSDLAVGNLYARWLVALAPDPELAWTRLRPTARRKVKKAHSNGVQVRLAEKLTDMYEYYRLHLQTRTKKHGMPAQPLTFFLRLWDIFAPSGQLHLELAEYKDQVIAAHITALSGNTTRYLYGASDERFHDLGAGYLLTWEAIARGGKLGYQQLDLGRTAYESSGLMQFKRSWGAVEQASPYYYFPALAGLASTSESSRSYQLLTRCWRRLPLQISAPLGGYLYRHLG